MRGNGGPSELRSTSGPSPLLQLSSTNDQDNRIIGSAALADNRDEFHIRERYLSRPSPQNTVRKNFLDNLKMLIHILLTTGSNHQF